MKLITFIIAGVFIFLSAFVTRKEETTQVIPLYETRWALDKIYTSAGMEEVKTKAFIVFNQEKNSAGGNASCNSFGSSVNVTDQQLGFTNIFSTKMHCEAVQKTEDAFLKQLGNVNRFEIKDKILVLYRDKEKLLEFITH